MYKRQVAVEPVQAPAPTPTPAPAAPEEDEKPEHIEMKAPKLEGPKIIGRIELPVSQPGGSRDSKEKRNRKRIPVQKKPETFNPVSYTHLDVYKRQP